MQFQDKTQFNTATKELISLRDGFHEYYGSEIGKFPADKLFRVYRSPQTVLTVKDQLPGLPLTNGHTGFVDNEKKREGNVLTSDIVGLEDRSYDASIGIKNRVTLGDSLLQEVGAGKRELSLGYNADLVPHEKYDFEQVNIKADHLAVVDAGRCGGACQFADQKPKEKVMTKQNFKDAEGDAPEAGGDGDESSGEKITVAKLQELIAEMKQVLPTLDLADAKEFYKAVKAALPSGGDDGEGDDDGDKSNAGTQTQDQAMRRQMQDAIKALEESKFFADCMPKVREYAGDEYITSGKTSKQVMRDVLTISSNQKFSDEELPVAFRMLPAKREKRVTMFSDSAGVKERFKKVDARRYNIGDLAKFEDSFGGFIKTKAQSRMFMQDGLMTGLIPERFLTTIDPVILEQQFADLSFLQLGIGIDNTGGWGNTIETLKITEQGGFKESSDYGDDKGQVSLSGEDKDIRVKEFHAEMVWGDTELKQAELANQNLTSRLLQAMNKKYNTLIDEIGYIGHNKQQGLLNNAEFAKDANDIDLTAADGDDIYQQIADAINAQVMDANSITSYAANRMVTSPRVLNFLRTKRIGKTSTTATATTVYRELVTNFPDLQIYTTVRAQDMKDKVATGDRITLFSNTKESLLFRLPIPLYMSSTFEQHFKFSVEAKARVAGLDIFESVSGRYINIKAPAGWSKK